MRNAFKTPILICGLSWPLNALASILQRRCIARSGVLVPAVNHDPSRIGGDPENSGMIGAANEIVTDGDWFQVSPYGEFKNVVGLQIVDRQAADDMVSEFNSLAAKLANRFRGVPFFVGHPDADDPEDREIDPRYGKAKVARGLELAARNDGLWARSKLSVAGKEIVDNGYFDFLSPYWGMRPVPGRKGAFRPAVLWSVGFTNNPNIPGLPVGRNTQQKGKDTMPKWLIEMLTAAGVLKPAANEATETEVKGVVTTLLELPGKLKKATEDLLAAQNEKKEVETKLTAANTLAATNEEKFKTERKQVIDLHLTSAVNEGRIKESDRPEWAGKLTSNFDGELKNLQGLKKAVNTDSKAKNLGNRKGEGSVSGVTVAAINTAASKYAKENGLDPAKDRTLIFNALRQQQPKLFETEEATA